MTFKTLFINRLTTVDCALLISNKALVEKFKQSNLGNNTPDVLPPSILGFSYNVSVEVVGELDEHEQVIVDFSKLKKDIKAWIDGKHGPDHKLIGCRETSSYQSLQYDNGISVHLAGSEDESKRLAHIPFDAFYMASSSKLKEALDGITVMDLAELFSGKDGIFHSYTTYGNMNFLPDPVKNLLLGLAKDMKTSLNYYLKSLYTGKKIEVSRIVCDIIHSNPPMVYDEVTEGHGLVYATAMFPYTHGLNNSTSYGCKNIAHGHLSYVSLQSKVDVTAPVILNASGKDDSEANIFKHQVQVNKLALEISNFLFNAHFVHDINLIEGEPESNTTLEGYTNERGTFEMVLPSKYFLEKLAIGDNIRNLEHVKSLARPMFLDSETTIENLVDCIYDNFKEKLEALSINAIYVSEGLHKGSWVNVGHSLFKAY